jgi:hypothetical protein
MIERRQVDHERVLQLGKTLLLLIAHQELLLDLPAVKQSSKTMTPIQEFSKAS